MPIQIYGAEIKQWTFPGGERGLSIVSGDSERLNSIRLDYRSSDDLIDLALAVDAIRGMAATYLDKKISLHIPYFPYARQDRRANRGESLSVAVVAKFINSLGFYRVLIEDPHSDVLVALLDNVEVMEQDECFRNTLWVAYPPKTKVTVHTGGVVVNPYMRAYETIEGQDVVLLAPDAGAAKKIYKTAEKLKAPVITAIKHRDTVTGQISGTAIYDQESLRNKDVWVLDDICDGGRTFVELAKAIAVPVKSLNLYVTHGIFSKGKEELAKYYTCILAKNDWTRDIK